MASTQLGDVSTGCNKKFKDIHIPKFLLNGETLPRVSKYKYLGHIITEDLDYATMMTYLGNTREFMLRVMP